eukprot:jgi/Hompol1/1109/HPOL_005514-RA
MDDSHSMDTTILPLSVHARSVVADGAVSAGHFSGAIFISAPCPLNSPRILGHFDQAPYLGLDNLTVIESIPDKFSGMFPDALGLVRHIRFDMAVPLGRTESNRESAHFLGQVFAAGHLLSACTALQSLDVHLSLAPRLVASTVALRDPMRGDIPIQTLPIDQYPAFAEPAEVDRSSISQSITVIDDTPDESDEEAVSMSVSRMLVPAIRTLEVMLRRCRFKSTIRIGWTIDFPFAKPARLIVGISPLLTHLMATTPSQSSSPSSSLASSPADSPLSKSPTSAHSIAVFRLVHLTLTDASSTHPRKLTEILRKLPQCESLTLKHASITTTLLTLLDRRIHTLTKLHLTHLNTLDENTFFNT